MKRYRGKKTSILLVITLLLSMFLPQLASAYTVAGDSSDPTLTIYKYEQEPGDSQTEGTGNSNQTPVGKPLSGVEFTVIQTHSYDPQTDKWTVVSGATPIVATTDTTGKIVLTKANGLELGRYSVQETDGPKHVNLNTELFHVDVPMTNKTGSELNYNVTIYPKNETIRGAVELHKIDGETDLALSGVVFDLYNAQDQVIQAGLVTDGNGYIRVNALEYGDYYFKEISAPGEYVVNSNKLPFSITQSGTIQPNGTKTGVVETIEVENFIAPAIQKTVNGSTKTHETNRETEFTYNLVIYLPDDITEYKNFDIMDTLDSRLTYTGTWTVDGISTSNLAFTQTGQTLKWSIKDFSILGGVEIFTINFNAKINGDAPVEQIPNTGDIEFTNGSNTNGSKETKPVHVIPTEGLLKITKQDPATNEKLVGAEFELRLLDGTVVKSGVTNVSGELVWAGLDYGKYQLVETKAPDGYRILQKPIDITIDHTNNMVELTVDNYKNGWNLPTTGGIGTILFTAIGSVLMGIALTLYIRRKRVVA